MKTNNRPPHLYFDSQYYFITARTVNKRYYFNTDQKKQILFDVIEKAMEVFSCSFVAWVILNNHYHLLFRLLKGVELPRLINNIHSNSSRILNRLENVSGRNVWWNYWDRCIRDEADFWRHFNYIHHNPIKHGCVKNMEDYKFSSYRFWLERKGQAWIESCFWLYPIVDFTGVN